MIIFLFFPKVQLIAGLYNRGLSERDRLIHARGLLWSGSYFSSSCGGVTVEVLKKYVQEQNRPD